MNEALVASLALGGVCLLMWWLARLAKRRMGIGAGTVSPAALRVVGKRPIDQKSSLYVVEIAGGRHILLGSSIDGSVTKLDDISPEEFAIMTADEQRPAARPRLRVAAAVPEQSPEAAGDADGVDGDLGEGPSPIAEPRFATVGESFGLLLGKAREARDTRRDRRASGE